jgi:deazaflavin-dependent oxidoreductase (nitroreductase family)
MGQLQLRPNVVQRALHPILRTKASGWFLARTLHHFDRPIVRLSRGRRALTSMLAGLPVVTATTIGAKSGQPRSLPLVALPDGENVILIASNFGQKHHPAWYYNLRTHPEVQLTYEGKMVAYVAHETSGAERERCWQHAVDLYSGYARYKERAGQRQIGIFLLTPQVK